MPAEHRPAGRAGPSAPVKHPKHQPVDDVFAENPRFSAIKHDKHGKHADEPEPIDRGLRG